MTVAVSQVRSTAGLAKLVYPVLFILWAANGFWSFLPQPLNHLILVVLLAILGFKVLGNPIN